ncbi:APC family permease [Nocardioides litoris]|uniref:APC family permease n=1 Tax=Nocardioides litoris TaxID=1926648 RepID=UPI001122F73A|nr:APC family permease [Nocardioides litoris]
MTDLTRAPDGVDDEPGLKRTISGRLLFFYVLGDVLGSGIYVLIGAVAGEVGGAFWLAFAIGVSIAVVTGAAYAELVTKYPRAAGAALFVDRAFGNRVVTFVVTVSMLAASFAATGSLATGFAGYFAEVWALPPALLVSLALLAVLAVVHHLGITESVVANAVMTVVEVAGLLVITLVALALLASGDGSPGRLTDFSTSGNEAFAVLAGVALAFFAMTGFENAANVAEETVDPQRCFPRALIGGMVVAGIIYVVVAAGTSMVVDTATLADSEVPLTEVVVAGSESGLLPLGVGVVTVVFALIAMTAITNTTLVTFVTQPRILYGMAREDVVPGAFARLHARRRTPWVGSLFSVAVVGALLLVGSAVSSSGSDLDLVTTLADVTVLLLLAVYSMVIAATFALRGRDEGPEVYHAPRPVLVLGLVGNLAVAVYMVVADWTSLLWVGGLLAVGFVLFAAEWFLGGRTRPAGAGRGDPSAR